MKNIRDCFEIWHSTSNTTHDNYRTHKTKFEEKHETFPFALSSDSDSKTLLKTAKLQFLNSKVSILAKNKDTFFNINLFIDLLKNVSKNFFERIVRKNLNTMSAFVP